MVSKGIASAIGIAVIGTSSVVVAKPEWLGMDYMPSWHSLSEDSDYESTYNQEGQFGKKYGKYLVGVTEKKNSNKKTSEYWWHWAFRRLNEEDISKGKFSNKGANANAKRAFSSSDPKALNQVCKKAYETKDNEFNDNDDNKFKKSDVWKYCSAGRTQPKTLKDTGSETYDNGKIGNEQGEKEKLLSINSNDNKWVWDLKDSEFKNLTSIDDGYFKSEHESKDKSLKQICENAYKKPENKNGSGKDKITKDSVVKYCSLT